MLKNSFSVVLLVQTRLDSSLNNTERMGQPPWPRSNDETKWEENGWLETKNRKSEEFILSAQHAHCRTRKPIILQDFISYASETSTYQNYQACSHPTAFAEIHQIHFDIIMLESFRIIFSTEKQRQQTYNFVNSGNKKLSISHNPYWKTNKILLENRSKPNITTKSKTNSRTFCWSGTIEHYEWACNCL